MADFKRRAIHQSNGYHVDFFNDALEKARTWNKKAHFWKHRNKQKASEAIKKRDHHMSEICLMISKLNLQGKGIV